MADEQVLVPTLSVDDLKRIRGMLMTVDIKGADSLPFAQMIMRLEATIDGATRAAAPAADVPAPAAKVAKAVKRALATPPSPPLSDAQRAGLASANAA